MEFVDYSLVCKIQIERECLDWVCFSNFGISASFTFYLVQQKYTEEQREDNPVPHFLFLKNKSFALQTAKLQQ